MKNTLYPDSTRRLKVYVGPTLVAVLADKFREAGVTVTVEGTGYVYCEMKATHGDVRVEFLTRLLKQHATKFGLGMRDVLEVDPHYEF